MNTSIIIIFLVIFIASAAITLASLPGWIKIPESYQKTLFTALILEVVACVFLLFKQANIENNKLRLNREHEWAAISTDGKLFQLKVNDSVVGLGAKEFEQKARTMATYKMVKEPDPKDAMTVDFLVKNDSTYIGKVSMESLKAMNLFNGIETSGSEFERITFTESSDRWVCNESFPDSWNITVVMDGKYSISDTKTSEVYYSGGESFNKTIRKLHFIKASDNSYYLVRIGSAIMNGQGEESNSVTFFVIRFEPTLSKT